MTPLEIAFWGLALVGHGALWIKLENSIHGTAAPTWAVKLCSAIFGAVLAGVPAWAAWRFWSSPPASLTPWKWQGTALVAGGYAALCAAIALGPVAWWVVARLRHRQSPLLLSNHSSFVDVIETLGHKPLDAWHRSLSVHFPFNDNFRLECNEKQLVVPRLPVELDGLTIGHFSDLHLSGVLSRDFFRLVMERMAEMNAELLVLCGDLIDHQPCIDWFPELLQDLTAQHGAYFILGNHDWRTGGSRRLRQTLVGAGWIDLGGNSRMLEVRGKRVYLAGNELPWYPPAAEVPRSWGAGEGPDLTVAVSHSPDQYRWARERDFDLLLAGHMHGGQICAPWFGPLIAPSVQGVRYAAGAFFEHPTVMHVSRGVAGKNPFRFRCPPELTKLVLRRPTTDLQPMWQGRL